MLRKSAILLMKSLCEAKRGYTGGKKIWICGVAGHSGEALVELPRSRVNSGRQDEYHKSNAMMSIRQHGIFHRGVIKHLHWCLLVYMTDSYYTLFFDKLC